MQQKQLNNYRNIALEQKNTINEMENNNYELCKENQILSDYANDLEIKLKEVPSKTYVGKFELTYYCISGTTKSGTNTKPHVTVAVDPNVIPLGSKLYIEGLGYRVAEDTGGVIKGNKIDVYVTTYDEAISNGVTPDAKVWILEN